MDLDILKRIWLEINVNVRNLSVVQSIMCFPKCKIIICVRSFQAFAIIDTDKDGKINADDLERMTPDHWNEITTIFKVSLSLCQGHFY